MCRAMVYLGQPVLIDDLIYQPDSSLVKQSFMPRMLHMPNLAGFGMMAWDRQSHDPERPHSYRATSLPVFDRNLESLARKVRADCAIAHVRGVAYNTDVVISLQNTHPFHFPGVALAMAHNGDLYRMDEMKPLLAPHIRPDFLRQIRGTTDSEWVYALLISQLADPSAPPGGGALQRAVEATLRILRRARAERGIDTSSSLNLFMADGHSLAAVRFCFDFGRFRLNGPATLHEANMNFLSLWYTSGHEFGFHEGEWKMIGGSEAADSVIVASEPLSLDTTAWLQVPEYGMLYATTEAGRPSIDIHYLDA